MQTAYEKRTKKIMHTSNTSPSRPERKRLKRRKTDHREQIYTKKKQVRGDRRGAHKAPETKNDKVKRQSPHVKRAGGSKVHKKAAKRVGGLQNSLGAKSFNQRK